MMQLVFSSKTPAEYAIAFASSLSAKDAKKPNPASIALERDPDLASSLGCAFLRARAASPAAAAAAAGTIAASEVRVLVITGGWSPAFDVIGATVGRMTRGHHVIVKAPDHFVQLSAADALNRELDSFLREAEQA